jgi:hypothetical protein
MLSQIFKKNIPNNTLFQLLDHNTLKTDKYYVIDNNSYRKGIFNNTIPTFLEECKPFYHIAKRKKYLERDQTYNSYITIIRQICNFNKITYTSQIKYDKSKYDIVYHVYF